ncbi:putative pentatricopeptide repeat-containing protein At5g40405 [Rutidosis leptorrhynchoides]|uniref:putative pentatricopeptide repeat-containing protein At5g40405 n=1 Tax=Rutidosis leptorrhynchoides TaxID=125765 RepID=UPI003A99B28F
MQVLRKFLKNPTISIVETCKSLTEINQIHSQLLVNGFINEPELVSKFAASIAIKHPHNIHYSVQLLNRCENPTIFALNSLIRVYSKTSTPEKSFHFYNRILNLNKKPDNYTFTFLIKSCVSLIVDKALGLGVHGAVLKYGLDHDPHLQSGLIYMYAEMGFLGEIKDLFLDVNKPDLVTQTAMVAACAKLGDIGYARHLFDKMPERDVVAWNAMISGYVQFGEPINALKLFFEMERKGLKVNEASMVSVLSACTYLSDLRTGRWAHRYIRSNGLKVKDLRLGSALVHMYAKCGDIDLAMAVFWRMNEKNVYTWSGAIGGLAMNGYGEKCLELYGLMLQGKIQPNGVTFTSVLKGCIVSGLVEEGCKHFQSMIKEYGIEPQLEHYGCMVDLYGLSGRLDEALKFIYSMPIAPHAGVWGALLNASKIHNNVELAELASRKLVELEAKNDGAYVQLSNVYAGFNKWDSVDDVRLKMKSQSVAKVPGISIIN